MNQSDLLNHVLREISSLTGHDPVCMGNGWFNCHCPSHEDSTPSLGIRAGDDGIILNCFAGCVPEHIASSIGMEIKELFYDKPTKQKNKSTTKTPALTIGKLAAAKHLPAPLLIENGCEQDGDVVRIRYRLLDGSDAPRHRRRTGISGTSGSRWYGKKADGDIVPYGLWRTADAHPKRAIIIVEGESDCWTLWHYGFAALGIPGATTDSCLRAEHFSGIDSVYIFSEPDKAGRGFPHRIAARLTKIGLNLTIKIITPDDYKDPSDLHLKDADNFISRFRLALKNALPLRDISPAPPLDSDPKNQEEIAPDDGALPQDVADAFCADHTIVFYNGLYFNWAGRCYRHWPDDYMTARVTGYIRRTGYGKPSTNFVNNTTLNIRAQTLVDPTLEPPAWLSAAPSTDTHVAVSNGLLNIDRLLRGDGTNALGKHTPDFFSLNALDFPYDKTADCDAWLTFLDEILPDDGLQRILQEWFGYCLIPSQKYQRILLMQGEGANGKSVIQNILKALIGRGNCAAVQLEMLPEKNSTSSLLGKLVNFCNELTYLKPACESILKAITGGDPVQVEYKFKDAFDATLFARFVISTNNTPHISDRSDGLWRRLIVMPFEVQIPLEKQIPMEAMIAKLSEELPGILTWALLGLHRLQNRGRFEDCDKTSAMKQQYRADSNPARTWIEENLSILDQDANRYEEKSTVYKAYREAIKELGLKPSGSPTFGTEVYRWMQHTRPDIPINKSSRVRINGRLTTVYEHIIMPITGASNFDEQ